MNDERPIRPGISPEGDPMFNFQQFLLDSLKKSHASGTPFDGAALKSDSLEKSPLKERNGDNMQVKDSFGISSEFAGKNTVGFLFEKFEDKKNAAEESNELLGSPKFNDLCNTMKNWEHSKTNQQDLMGEDKESLSSLSDSGSEGDAGDNLFGGVLDSLNALNMSDNELGGFDVASLSAIEEGKENVKPTIGLGNFSNNDPISEGFPQSSSNISMRPLPELSFLQSNKDWAMKQKNEEEELNEFKTLEMCFLPSIGEQHEEITNEEIVVERSIGNSQRFNAGVFEFPPDVFGEESAGKNDNAQSEEKNSENIPTKKTSFPFEESETGDNNENYVDDFSCPEKKSEKESNQKMGKRHNRLSVDSRSSDTPPTSRLVSKLFSGLKQNTLDTFEVRKEQEEFDMCNNEEYSQSPSLQALEAKMKDKLNELEEEIGRYNKEKEEIKSLKKELENGKATLSYEMRQFDEKKEAELNRLQEFRDKELASLNHDKMVFKQYSKQILNRPDKSARDEISALKSELQKLNSEMKNKEAKHQCTIQRYKNQIAGLQEKNAELENDLRSVEKARLEAWKRMASEKSFSGESSKHRDNPAMAKAGTGDGPMFISYGEEDIVDEQVVALSSSESDNEDELSQSDCSDAAAIEVLPEMKVQGVKSGKEILQVSLIRDYIFCFLNVCLPILYSTDVTAQETYNPATKQRDFLYVDGSTTTIFGNGTRKEVSSDFKQYIVHFFNGDCKEYYPEENRVVYHFSEANTKQTTYGDGREHLIFANGQEEWHFPDETKKIKFPDGTTEIMHPDGKEVTTFANGTVQTTWRDSTTKMFEYPDGEKEVHCEEYISREYTNGMKKYIYPNGNREVHYKDGRIKTKNRLGQIISERRVSVG
eukprot:Nk52_evm3s252 gene=Nk52_evmTU3s252